MDVAILVLVAVLVIILCTLLLTVGIYVAVKYRQEEERKKETEKKKEADKQDDERKALLFMNAFDRHIRSKVEDGTIRIKDDAVRKENRRLWKVYLDGMR